MAPSAGTEVPVGVVIEEGSSDNSTTPTSVDNSTSVDNTPSDDDSNSTSTTIPVPVGSNGTAILVNSTTSTSTSRKRQAADANARKPKTTTTTTTTLSSSTRAPSPSSTPKLNNTTPPLPAIPNGYSALPMGGIDKIHATGNKGKGVKIAVLDSGVFYDNPALGGCFGAGCRIAGGYDYVSRCFFWGMAVRCRAGGGVDAKAG